VPEEAGSGRKIRLKKTGKASSYGKEKEKKKEVEKLRTFLDSEHNAGREAGAGNGYRRRGANPHAFGCA